jgi:serine/threonine-protein kinase HipA
MPLRDQVYVFADLPLRTFHGLPGLLADSLPDRFGNALIDAWLATQGRTPDSFNAVERLCYTGERGMGALEFAPAIGQSRSRRRRLRLTPWSNWRRRF